MIKVSDLFRQLSYGELANYSTSLEGTGGIKKAHIPKLIYFLNDALIRMYSQTVIKQKDTYVRLINYVTFYKLDKQFSVHNTESTAPYKYIEDGLELFKDDAIAITRIYSENHPYALSLNNNSDPYSIYLPEPLAFQVSYPENDIMLAVTYQAKHPIITSIEDDLELPHFLIEALKAYIAYLYCTSVGSKDSIPLSQLHYQRYQTIMNEIMLNDTLRQTYVLENTSFVDNGWV